MPYKDPEARREYARRWHADGRRKTDPNAWLKSPAGREWWREYRRAKARQDGVRSLAEIQRDAEARKIKRRLAKRSAQFDAHVKRYRAVLSARVRSAARAATARGKIEARMKTAIGKALRGGKGGRRWERLVGYSLGHLMSHLESLFVDGMSWENIGLWHIDHIRPKSSFSYQSVDCPEFRECWALANLQPLWAEANWRKGATIQIRSASLGPAEA